MILAIFAQTNSWWAMWSIRTHEFESYFDFLTLIFPQLLFVIIAYLLSPPIDSVRFFDLRAFCFRQIRWVAPLFAFQLTSLARSKAALGVEQLIAPVNGIRVAVVSVFLFLGFSDNEKIHHASVLTVCALFALSLVIAAF